MRVNKGMYKYPNIEFGTTVKKNNNYTKQVVCNEFVCLKGNYGFHLINFFCGGSENIEEMGNYFLWNTLPGKECPCSFRVA